jgi:hypothetical protein
MKLISNFRGKITDLTSKNVQLTEKNAYLRDQNPKLTEQIADLTAPKYPCAKMSRCQQRKKKSLRGNSFSQETIHSQCQYKGDIASEISAALYREIRMLLGFHHRLRRMYKDHSHLSFRFARYRPGREYDRLIPSVSSIFQSHSLFVHSVSSIRESTALRWVCDCLNREGCPS